MLTGVYIYVCMYECRPLTTMRPESLVLEGKFREKKMLHETVRSILKTTNGVQKDLHSQYQSNKRSMMSDVKKLHETKIMQMSALDRMAKNKASTKDLLTIAVEADKFQKTGASIIGSGSGSGGV